MNFSKSNLLSNLALVLSILSLFISIYGLIGLVSLILGFVIMVKNREIAAIQRKPLITIILSLISIIYAYCMMSAYIGK